MLRRRIAPFIIGLLLLSVGRAAHAEIKLSMRLLADPETLDWNLAHTMVETHVLMNIMEGLVELDSSLRPQAALAEKWKVSPDGKTYTFTLRKGTLWSDGVPLKASDFEYGWKRLLDPKTGAPYAYFLFDVEGAEEFNKGKLADFSKVGIRALDDSTFVVKLKRPVAHWIQIPTFWVTFPVRKDIVEKYGRYWAKPGRMATVGPFIPAEYVVDSKIVLKRNPHYKRKLGNLERVDVYIVRDDAAAFHLYESGTIDFLNDISTITLSRINGGEKRADLKTFPYLKLLYLGFVVTMPEASKLELRKAIAHSIDKTKIERFLHGGQTPAQALCPPPLPGSSGDWGIAFDPEKGRKLLKSAKIDPGKIGKFEILAVNNDKSLAVAQYVQQELNRNLGLKTQLQAFDSKTYFKERSLKRYPAFFSSWGADYPDPDNFLSIFLSDGGNNNTFWKNAEYDRLTLAARGEMDRARKEKLTVSAQKILLEEQAVIVPLYFEPNVVLVRPKVRGLDLNPMNVLNLRGVDIVP